jgi:hypothetical protein
LIVCIFLFIFVKQYRGILCQYSLQKIIPMTIEELNKERLYFIESIEMYPRMQGKRNDLAKKEKYDRGKMILSRMTKYWPHYGKYIADRIDDIHYYLVNDTPNLFFTKMLLVHKWRPLQLINFMKDGYYEMDLMRDDIVVSKVYENGHLSPYISRKKIIEHYQEGKTLLYFLKYESSHPDLTANPIKKIGVTNELTRRLVVLNTSCPFEISVEKAWFVRGVSAETLENRIHKKFSDRNVKGEWFTDLDGKLLDKMLKYVNTMEDCELISYD